VKRRGVTLIEMMVVMAIVIIMTGAAAPSFYRLTISNRLQTNAAQLVGDLRMARESAILYQQNLRVYIQTAAPSGSRTTTYYYETFLKVPSSVTHWTTNDDPVTSKWVRRTLNSNILFGAAPGQFVDVGADDTLGRRFFYVEFSSGSGSSFRGQPVSVASRSTITLTDLSSGKNWYVILESTGSARTSGSPPS
jgi:prepilin-type N-terminal cleavage/methylation domain-containing protein